MPSSGSGVWGSRIDYLGPMESTESWQPSMTEEMAAILTSQEFPKLILSCSINIYESNSNSGMLYSEHRYAVHDLRCFTHSLSLAKLVIRGMMTQTRTWMRVPSVIRETMITKIAADLMRKYRLNEGSNPALGYALIPLFQLEVLVIKDDEEEQQSFDAAQRDDVVVQCRPVFAALLGSLVTEVVGAVEDDHKEECVICKDEFVTGAEVKRLPCSHRFHGECITHWFQEKNTCPLCRHSIQV